MGHFNRRWTSRPEAFLVPWQWETSTVMGCKTWLWPISLRTAFQCFWETGMERFNRRYVLRLARVLFPSDGSFQPPSNFAAGSGPVSVAVGDFNGDRVPDLVVANTLSNNVSVLLGNGDGSFQQARSFAADRFTGSVVVGDFNGDELLDLAVTNQGPHPGFSDGSLLVLLGNGNGSFQGARSFAVGPSPRSVVVGDFNGDGKPDLTVVNQAHDNVSVLINNTHAP